MEYCLVHPCSRYLRCSRISDGVPCCGGMLFLLWPFHYPAKVCTSHFRALSTVHNNIKVRKFPDIFGLNFVWPIRLLSSFNFVIYDMVIDWCRFNESQYGGGGAVISSKKLLDLGFKYKYSLEEIIDDSVQYFEKVGILINWRSWFHFITMIN